MESPTGTPRVLLGDRAKGELRKAQRGATELTSLTVRVTILKIVENALKHTQQGGILIEWGETMQGANMDDDAVIKADGVRISISVTDTGCGIPESKLEVSGPTSLPPHRRSLSPPRRPFSESLRRCSRMDPR